MTTEPSIDLTNLDLDRFDVVLDTKEAVLSALFSGTLYLLSFFVHLNVFKLLQRKKGRAVNKIIYCQQVKNS